MDRGSCGPGETHSTVQSGASKMSKLERLNSLGASPRTSDVAQDVEWEGL